MRTGGRLQTNTQRGKKERKRIKKREKEEPYSNSKTEIAFIKRETVKEGKKKKRRSRRKAKQKKYIGKEK